MALVRNIDAKSTNPNQVDLSWDAPLGLNDSSDEVIVTRTITHYPVELFDDTYPCADAVDSRPVEIFRGSSIVGLNESAISTLTDTLTDTSATFPISPPLNGRLLRDASSKVYRIASNTATTITVESGEPVAGKYVILADFPCAERTQQNFELDARTLVGAGFIEDLVEVQNGALIVVQFEIDELANLIFRDGAGELFVIKSNTANRIEFFGAQSFLNDSLIDFTYTGGTGIIQYVSAVDLSSVKVGHKFIDSEGVSFDILAVNDSLDQITLATGLTVNTASPIDSSVGSVDVVPVVGAIAAIFNNFNDSTPYSYIDNYRTESEALTRVGTILRDNQFYYYTAFNKEIGSSPAKAEYSNIETSTSTQISGISPIDRDFGTILYNYWPTVYRQLDSTGDLEDLMQVFGVAFNQLHALIDTYELQNTHKVAGSALLPLSEQTGLVGIGSAIGIDTLRRIAKDLIAAWKIKGSKEGIALFIRILTTWDITGGTGDFSAAIEDFLPNVEALRFFDPNLGSLNTRITSTVPFVAGGRFAKSLPGIVIPGFFTFREFVVNIPDVAIEIGVSEDFTLADNQTIMTDATKNYGPVDSLVGNFLLPNTEEINDIFEIISNTSNTITVRGIVNNRVAGGDYAILSPLNTNRFIILNRLLPLYIPFGTRAGFRFICN